MKSLKSYCPFAARKIWWTFSVQNADERYQKDFRKIFTFLAFLKRKKRLLMFQKLRKCWIHKWRSHSQWIKNLSKQQRQLRIVDRYDIGRFITCTPWELWVSIRRSRQPYFYWNQNLLCSISDSNLPASWKRNNIQVEETAQNFTTFLFASWFIGSKIEIRGHSRIIWESCSVRMPLSSLPLARLFWMLRGSSTAFQAVPSLFGFWRTSPKTMSIGSSNGALMSSLDWLPNWLDCIMKVRCSFGS